MSIPCVERQTHVHRQDGLVEYTIGQTAGLSALADQHAKRQSLSKTCGECLGLAILLVSMWPAIEL